jgi:hypothetical protein
VNYDAFTSMLINAVKELHAKWSGDSRALHAEIDQLRRENAVLKNAVCEVNPQAQVCR